jgi:hypothetical protein
VEEVTSLRVSRETRNRLSVIGSKDDTFDKIIQRLIDFYENSGEMSPLASRKRAGQRSTFTLPKRQEES